MSYLGFISFATISCITSNITATDALSCKYLDFINPELVTLVLVSKDTISPTSIPKL